MATDSNDNQDRLDTSDVPDELTDEVAAAVAELKAAQAKLDAVKAKMTPEATDSPDASDGQPAPTQNAPTPPPDPYVQPAYSPQSTVPPQNPVPPQGAAPTQSTVPPQTPQPQPQYYYQQQYSQPMVATKDHVAAGLLGIFLGCLGIHKFYLGYNTAGFIMLAVTILGSILTLGIAGAVVAIIGFIEGILYLVKSQSEFEQIYVFNKREWF